MLPHLLLLVVYLSPAARRQQQNIFSQLVGILYVDSSSRGDITKKRLYNSERCQLDSVTGNHVGRGAHIFVSADYRLAII